MAVRYGAREIALDDSSDYVLSDTLWTRGMTGVSVSYLNVDYN